MTDSTRSVAVAVFDNQPSARIAIQDLKNAGFTDAQIGVIARDPYGSAPDYRGRAAADPGDSKAAEGAAVGAAAGAGVGALWALGIAAGMLPAIGPVIAGGILGSLLASAAGGAAVAGLAGALIGMGIPEEEAGYYEGQFHEGRTIVTVQAGSRYDEAVDILSRNHGSDMASRRAHATPL